MRKRAFLNTGLLIVGFGLFLLGLLLLTRESTITSLFSRLFPNSDALETFAVTMQLTGGVAVVFGVTKVAATSFLISMQTETQALKSGFNQTMERIDKLITVQKASITAVEAKANVAAQAAAAAQRAVATFQGTSKSIPTSYVLSNCKFCGTKVESGRFCPKCGRAQS